MTGLAIQNLQAGYGNKTILDNINLALDEGEMIALLGPSGCGKTTFLNALCGFVPISGGSIKAGQRDISQLPPESRNITMVFQSYALWPHMTVEQNIAYGLKVRKVGKVQIAARVAELITTLNLNGLGQEKVTSLSGGQRQRVALARALAINPDVLVLDEPLSNLDAKVRLRVRHEIKSLQKQLGFTSLIVTHDQEEALVMADRIAILNQGRIEQLGTPEEIFHQPATPFVADFMGADNQLVWPQETSIIHFLPDSRTSKSASVKLFFRSENAIIETSKTDDKTGLTINGQVISCVFLGKSYRISVQCGEHTFQAHHDQSLPVNYSVVLRVPNEALHVYDQLV
ncbi:ABC transporter ATP-binding protein [Marinomonas epiphytica]